MRRMSKNNREYTQILEHSLPIITLILIIVVGAIGWQNAYQTYNQNKHTVVTGIASVVERVALPFRISQLSQQPVHEELPVPVYGVSKEDIKNTWAASRQNGRSHEGADIFAQRGTPVFSATPGFVTELNIGSRGGKNVMIVGPGGHFYYYAHFQKIADGISPGEGVTTDTVIGFVVAPETQQKLHRIFI